MASDVLVSIHAKTEITTATRTGAENAAGTRPRQDFMAISTFKVRNRIANSMAI